MEDIGCLNFFLNIIIDTNMYKNNKNSFCYDKLRKIYKI